MAVVTGVTGSSVSIVEQNGLASQRGRRTIKLSGGTLSDDRGPIRGIIKCPVSRPNASPADEAIAKLAIVGTVKLSAGPYLLGNTISGSFAVTNSGGSSGTWAPLVVRAQGAVGSASGCAGIRLPCVGARGDADCALRSTPGPRRQVVRLRVRLPGRQDLAESSRGDCCLHRDYLVAHPHADTDTVAYGAASGRPSRPATITIPLPSRAMGPSGPGARMRRRPRPWRRDHGRRLLRTDPGRFGQRLGLCLARRLRYLCRQAERYPLGLGRQFPQRPWPRRRDQWRCLLCADPGRIGQRLGLGLGRRVRHLRPQERRHPLGLGLEPGRRPRPGRRHRWRRLPAPTQVGTDSDWAAVSSGYQRHPRRQERRHPLGLGPRRRRRPRPDDATNGDVYSGRPRSV